MRYRYNWYPIVVTFLVKLLYYVHYKRFHRETCFISLKLYEYSLLSIYSFLRIVSQPSYLDTNISVQLINVLPALHCRVYIMYSVSLLRNGIHVFYWNLTDILLVDITYTVVLIDKYGWENYLLYVLFIFPFIYFSYMLSWYSTSSDC